MIKGSDATTCPRCHQVIPNRAGWLDYIAVPPENHFWVEVKESLSTGYLSLPKLFTPGQRETLDASLEIGKGREIYIFLIMRDGPTSRAPDGVSAYLFTWDIWKKLEEKCYANGIKGLRRHKTAKLPGTEDFDMLAPYSLEWQAGSTKFGTEGHWLIPPDFRNYFYGRK